MNEDQFADALDGIVNGKYPAEADPLAAFARRIHDQTTDRLADRLADDRRAAIWKGLLVAHPHDTPTTGGAGPLSQPTLTAPTAFNPWVGRSFPPASKRSRLGVINDGMQVSITALAIVALVIAAFAAFPIIRGDRMPQITPTAFAAAPTTTAGETLASTGVTEVTPGGDQDDEWLRYIQPGECTAQPLSQDALATIAASPDVGAPREYTPLTTPDAAVAEEAALTARAAEACGLGVEGDPAVPTALMSDRFIAEQEESGPGNSWDSARNIELGKQVSAAYQDVEATDLIRVSDEIPGNDREPQSPGHPVSIAFLPSMAVQLPDGRIGIPGVSVLWSGHPTTAPQHVIDTVPWLVSGFVVLSDASGTWQVDELLPICFGDCDEGWTMWSGGATPPAATPEPTTGGLLPLPGTPIAPPEPPFPIGTPMPPLEPAVLWATWWPNEPAPIHPGPAPARPNGTPGPYTPPDMPPVLSVPAEPQPTQS